MQYKDLIKEKEDGEPVFLRLIDPRAGSTKLMDGTTPLEKLNMSEEGEAPMMFYPANGQKIESGVQLINDLLYYDNTMPVAGDNSPRLFISANCTNLIYSMRSGPVLMEKKAPARIQLIVCAILQWKIIYTHHRTL